MSPRTPSQEFERGVRAAITWLHKEAESMNDPHAKTVLNNAAFHLGTDKPTFLPTPPGRWVPLEPTEADLERMAKAIFDARMEKVCEFEEAKRPGFVLAVPTVTYDTLEPFGREAERYIAKAAYRAMLEAAPAGGGDG